MPSTQLLNLEGKKVGEVTLADTVFAQEPNAALLHEALKRQLANARAGTHKAKTRSEVAGGGRKPWRQKGTGRARAGSIRSPLWAGGGVIFGPQPRDYSLSMPQKARRLAIASALATRQEGLVVVKDFADLKEAKTRQMAAILHKLGLTGKKVFLVLDYACQTCHLVQRAARNLAGVKVAHINDLNVKDLLHCEHVLTTERTLEAINKRFACQAHDHSNESPDTQASCQAETTGDATPPRAKARGKKAEATTGEPVAKKVEPGPEGKAPGKTRKVKEGPEQ